MLNIDPMETTDLTGLFEIKYIVFMKTLGYIDNLEIVRARAVEAAKMRFLLLLSTSCLQC